MACNKCAAAFLSLETTDAILLDSSKVLAAMAEAFIAGNLEKLNALGGEIDAIHKRADFQVESIRKLKKEQGDG